MLTFFLLLPILGLLAPLVQTQTTGSKIPTNPGDNDGCWNVRTPMALLYAFFLCDSSMSRKVQKLQKKCLTWNRVPA